MDICCSGGSDVLGPTGDERAWGTGSVEDACDVGNGAVTAGAVDDAI